jgi:electron transfer flavoprotein beta subunit
VGWATGNLGEPRNDPQTGMRNMRTLMPALQKANAVAVTNETLTYTNVALPKQQRTTRVERNMTADDIACEIVQWIRE